MNTLKESLTWRSKTSCNSSCSSHREQNLGNGTSTVYKRSILKLNEAIDELNQTTLKTEKNRSWRRSTDKNSSSKK